jgi:transcriptional regulator GlxA family with amidase domain
MMHISVLVPESAVMEAVADPRYLFTTANQFLTAAGQSEMFRVELVGMSNEIRLLDGIYSVRTDRRLEELEKTDLIIIPALFGNLDQALQLNAGTIPWIIEQHRQGAEVASLCLGAFLLASTGLLNGKKCSTHWAFYRQFRERFPEVEIADGSIVTDEGGIYSSGGANSYWNLLLYLLEKYTNREIAVLAAKYFAIDIDRKNQGAFTIFNGQKDHKDETVIKAQEFIEQNYQQKILVDELTDRLALGRRSLERRFKQATQNTINEYVQRVKIEAAKRSFERTQKNIAEVMYEVGYTDSKAFRTVFRRITGLSPVEYRNKYNSGRETYRMATL